MQRNYDVANRELLAIITALETWRHYLQGSPHTVMILSNHKNLTYFKSPQKLNRRQVRWSLTLSLYDLNLVHIPGKRMVQSDALSWWPDHVPEKDMDNKDITMLPGSLFIQMINIDLYNLMVEKMMGDNFPNKMIQMMKKKEPLPMKSDLHIWETREGLLFYNRRCYVPNDQDLWWKILQKYNNKFPAGHPGLFKMMEAIRKHYWWPRMYMFTKNYIQGYAEYQKNKVNTHPSTPPLMLIKSTSTWPFAMLMMDFITDLPESKGYNFLLVVVDHGLSKGIVLISCTKTIDAVQIVNTLLNNIY